MAAWILSVLMIVLPPGKAPWRESEADGRARYTAIAEDIATVVLERPPLFAGPLGRERTAMLLASVAYLESGLRVDVDDGRVRGDGGRACTLWQLQAGPRCAELVEDRRMAAAEALEAMRRSWAACGGNVEGMLRVYASGSCSRGERESRERVTLGRKWFAKHPPPR